MKRIFIGIKVNDALADEIISWQERYKKKFNIRWISKDNLHLTLIPPWYEKDVEGVIEKINNLNFKLPPFEMRLDKITLGPTLRSPRLIWAEGHTPPSIFKLKGIIEQAIGIIPQKRRFKFHITLGRFGKERLWILVPAIKRDRISWKMKVSSFHLFESKLSPVGANYIVLKEFKL